MDMCCEGLALKGRIAFYPRTCSRRFTAKVPVHQVLPDGDTQNAYRPLHSSVPLASYTDILDGESIESELNSET